MESMVYSSGVMGKSLVDVLKMQMVYDGVIAGLKSPSYPVNTNDSIRVTAAATERWQHRLEQTQEV